MGKEFVPYEQALELKELGFDEPCCGYFGVKYKKLIECNFRDHIASDIVKAPIYQQSFRWFRKNYKLWYMVYPRDGWNYHIQGIDPTMSCDGESWSKVEIPTYEEAELECIRQLIKIAKEKK